MTTSLHPFVLKSLKLTRIPFFKILWYPKGLALRIRCYSYNILNITYWRHNFSVLHTQWYLQQVTVCIELHYIILYMYIYGEKNYYYFPLFQRGLWIHGFLSYDRANTNECSWSGFKTAMVIDVHGYISEETFLYDITSILWSILFRFSRMYLMHFLNTA